MMLACEGTADARRTAKGQFFAGADGVFSFTSFGTKVYMGQYLYNSRWEAWVSGVNRIADLVTVSADNSTVDYAHLLAGGDYMYLLLSTRDRVLNFYGGGGIFLGAEFADPFGKKPNGGVLPFSTSFVYGVRPAVELQVYPAERLSFVASAGLPVVIGSKVRVFAYEVALGLRYDF